MSIILRLFFAVGIAAPFLLQAQSNHTDEIPLKNDSAFVEISAIGATDASFTPFWLQANQWGSVPRAGNGGALRVGWEGTKYLGNKASGWRLIGGVEAVENITKEAKFLLPEAYGGLRIGKWEFFVGRRKQQVGLADSTLGSGSYIMSGNAMPNLRFQLGVYEFVSIPFTKGWLQFKGFYSDGFFDKDRPVVTELKLHQKQLYFKLGRPTGWLQLYGGFNHQVQWGGKSPYFFNAKKPDDRQMPKSFSSYLNMVTGRRGAPSPDHHDSTNRIGNHLGTIDLGMEIKTYGANFFIYRQSIYEDGSLIQFINLADGLNGIRIRKNNIYGSAFEIHEGVFEFLYTKSQGGGDFSMTDPKIRGRDNYFNNYQVRDGWSYQQRTIGTPFITPGIDTRATLGQQYIYGDSFTNNNRVWAAHFGLKGAVMNALLWSAKFSYSKNFGVYDLENVWPEEGFSQFSGVISLKRTTAWLGGTTFGGSFAMDYGDLYPVNYGAILSIRKHLNF